MLSYHTLQANPRIQAHAAAALFNVVDECPGEIIQGHVDTMMKSLLALLNHSQSMVIGNVMTTIAAISGVAPQEFGLLCVCVCVCVCLCVHMFV